MQVTKKNRRGVTIAEMVVALALLSVVCVMVFSFIIFINHRTRHNAANDAVMQDRQKIEAAVENWAKTFSAVGADFYVSSEKTAVYAGNSYFLRFDDGILQATYPDTEQFLLHTQCVTSVTFELIIDETSGDFLLFCTVISTAEDFDGEASYTFCVNPYEGERIGS